MRFSQSESLPRETWRLQRASWIWKITWCASSSATVEWGKRLDNQKESDIHQQAEMGNQAARGKEREGQNCSPRAIDIHRPPIAPTPWVSWANLPFKNAFTNWLILEECHSYNQLVLNIHGPLGYLFIHNRGKLRGSEIARTRVGESIQPSVHSMGWICGEDFLEEMGLEWILNMRWHREKEGSFYWERK